MVRELDNCTSIAIQGAMDNKVVDYRENMRIAGYIAFSVELGKLIPAPYPLYRLNASVLP
jgi:hypothetical protein